MPTVRKLVTYPSYNYTLGGHWKDNIDGMSPHSVLKKLVCSVIFWKRIRKYKFIHTHTHRFIDIWGMIVLWKNFSMYMYYFFKCTVGTYVYTTVLACFSLLPSLHLGPFIEDISLPLRAPGNWVDLHDRLHCLSPILQPFLLFVN